MIFVFAGIIIALFILQLGRWLGRREAEQEFEFMRWEMDLNTDREEGSDENTSGNIEK